MGVFFSNIEMANKRKIQQPITLGGMTTSGERNNGRTPGAVFTNREKSLRKLRLASKFLARSWS